MIKTHCTHCNSPLEVPPQYIGNSVNCNSCGQSFDALDDEERVFKFHCSNCEGPIQTTWNTLGSSAACPHCDLEITIEEDHHSTRIADDPQTDESEVSQSSPIDLPQAPLGPPPLPAKENFLKSIEDRACPYCAEAIKKDALICRFCQMNLFTGQLVGLDSRSQHHAAPTNRAGEGLIMSLFRIVTD